HNGTEVQAGGSVLVRLGFRTSEDTRDTNRLALEALLWARPARGGPKYAGEFKLAAPVELVPPVSIFPAERQRAGLIREQSSATVVFYYWSATREKLDVTRVGPANACLVMEPQPLSPRTTPAEWQELVKKLAAEGHARVRSAVRLEVTLYE